MNNEMSQIALESFLSTNFNTSVDDLLDFPKYLQIETSNICNARCVMCGIDFKKKGKSQTMSMELFEKIANGLKDHILKIRRVSLQGDNEPLTDPLLGERIKILKNIGIGSVAIFSNGGLLNEQKRQQILEAGIDQIHITIDSLDPDKYERIRSGLDFKTTYQNLLSLIEYRNKHHFRCAIRVQMIEQEINKNESHRFIEHFRKYLSVGDEIAIQPLHSYGSKLEKEINPKFISMPCQVLWSTLIIRYNGVVPLCCVDTDDKVILGNLNEKDVAEIWRNNPLLEEVRRNHARGQSSSYACCCRCDTWKAKSERILINV